LVSSRPAQKTFLAFPMGPSRLLGMELFALWRGPRGAEYALKIKRSASRIGGQRDVLRRGRPSP
jgi:hypothetical protein